MLCQVRLDPLERESRGVVTVLSRTRRIMWSTVSKEALRSRRLSNVTKPASAAR